MKKKLMALFAFVLIVVGVCFLNIEGSMVQAADIIGEYTDENGGDFKSVQYSEISEFRGKTYSAPTPEGYEDYLFAGWYSERECVNALPSSTKSGEAWAKFVPAGVLSVKSQISEPNAETGSYNMRIISTLDTLNYGAVGFKVEYNNNGKIIDIPIKEVYTRIKATAESGVDYNFSPKVVDTKSEYFMTATLLNINSEKTGNIFCVVPYWKTLDGTMVNGVNRYVAVDDGIANGDNTTGNDVFSFNVRQDALSDWSNLAVTGVDASNVKYRHKDGDKYVSVIVSGQNESTMSSATKFVITGADDESINVVHRNYNTTHIKSGSASANADKTWYTVYNGVDSTEDEYVIATSADLYGLSTLTQNSSGNKQTFDNQTVYVVADITLNDGEDATNWSSTSGPTYSWTPIGPSSYKFCGTFDAQMHTISGIYAKGTTYVGLFAYVRDADCTVKNLRLVNSYFYGSGDFVGSIAGRGAGTFDTIYSEAIVQGGATSGYSRTGGILGQLQDQDGAGTTSTINNCHFNGSVTGNGLYVGGIVGCHLQGTLNISNCFNEADVTANISTEPTEDTYTYTAGICGGVMNANNTVTISDNFNTGDVNAYCDGNSNSYFLSAGVVNTYKGNFVVERVYDTSNQTSVGRKNPDYSGGTTWRGYWKGDESAITGTEAFLEEATNTAGTVSYGKLDYYTSSTPNGAWIIRENDIPALKSFVNDGIDVAWYYDHEAEDTYTISTEEELYGLSALSASNTFAGKTINLNADIKLNNGIASEWAEKKTTVDRAWTIIGRKSSAPFEGTFDGNGHTIKGIYMTTKVLDAGFFGYINGATIQNLRIEDSYFESLIGSNQNANMGSIAGNGHGTLRNIYSNAIVYTDGKRVGGLMGYAGSSDGSKGVDIISCWFDGQVVISQRNASAVQCGGLVGYGRTISMDTCLNTGIVQLNHTTTDTTNKIVPLEVGGFIGTLGGMTATANAEIIIRNCLNAATIELIWTQNNNQNPEGFNNYGVMSGNNKTTELTISNSYSVANIKVDLSAFGKGISTSNKGKHSSAEEKQNVEYVSGGIDVVKGDLAKENTNLPFVMQERSDLNGTDTNETALWTTREGDLPIPGASVAPVVADTSWYDANDEIVTYHISTAEELYGFATLINGGTTFSGETIYLDKDIEINPVVKTDTEDTIKDWTAGNTGSVRLWTPIGKDDSVSFRGTFDGQGNTISGVYMTTKSTNAGLFGYIGNAIIQNLRLEDSYFESLIGAAQDAHMASVAGRGYGVLRNVYSNANVYTNGERVGGLVGYAGDTINSVVHTLDMISCVYDGKITFEQKIDASIGSSGQSSSLQSGGLVGYARSVVMDTCLCAGTIQVEHTSVGTTKKYSVASLNVGGLIGNIGTSATVRNSLNASTVNLIWHENTAFDETTSKFNNYGTIVGNATTLTAKNVYSVGTVNITLPKQTEPTVSYAEFVTDSGEQDKAGVDNTYAGKASDLHGDLAIVNTDLPFTLEDRLALNGSDTNETALWVSREGDLPIPGTSVAPVAANTSWYDESGEYHISTAEELYGFATLVNGGTTFSGEKIYLDEDIEINPVMKTDTEDTIKDWRAGNAGSVKVWTPIGTSANAFSGTFDGQEHTISGVYFSGNNKTKVGLFGVTQGAIIQNIAVTDSYFEMNMEKTGLADVGSIVGYADRNLGLENVYSNATINVSKAQRVGGLVGATDATSDAGNAQVTIRNSWYDGVVENESDAQMLTGGLLGFTVKGNEITLDSCVFSGTIKGVHAGSTDLDKIRVGGLVGACNSVANMTNFAIKNSLSAGTITVKNTEGNTITQVGSVVGNVNGSDNRSITTVYTTFESYSKAIGNGAPATQNIIYIEEESAWGITPCSFQGLDSTETWVPRKGKTPGLKSFSTRDYETYIVADRSWADDVDGGTEENPYIIADVADFLGLSVLSLEGNTFEGKTIQVQEGVTEIDLNPSWTAGSGVADVFWNPVGRDSDSSFKGTFDGNGATIKGIYNNSDNTTYVGLFGHVYQDATLKNFKLKNSHFVQNTGSSAAVGSVAAEMRGIINSVYSDAIVDSASQYSGGLFARVNGVDSKLAETTNEETGITTITYDRGTVSIQDAWFDGEMNVSYKTQGTAYRYVGGIIAIVIQGTVDMENILFTGTMDLVADPNRAYAGGIVGATMAQTIKSVSDTTVKEFQADDYTTVNLTSCISAGIVSQHSSQVGSIIGRVESKINTTKDENDVNIAAYPGQTYLNLENVFATSECHNQTMHVATTSVEVTDPDTNETSTVSVTGTVTGTTVVQTQYNSDRLIGYCTEKVTEDETAPKLDFNSAWTMRTVGVPIPSALKTVVETNTLVPDPSGLTAELGLDYWGSAFTLKDAVNSGKGNYLLNYTVSSEKTYSGFLAYLGEKGFEEYVNNSASTMAEDKVYNTTYFKDNWVLNITYVENKGTVDVIINTFGIASLSPNLFNNNVAQTENGTDVKLSMLSLANSGEMGEYGNSFVFQLPNGHFIIHDGGKNVDAAGLITYLKSLTNGDNVYIDAWVISHFHSDHSGALLELYTKEMKDYREGVYLEALYVNEPNNYAKTVESGNVIELAEKGLSGVMMFTKAPVETGEEPETPDVYRIHTGERYYFDGVTMDVVLTQEQIDPNMTPPRNTSDLPYRFYGDWDAFNATSTTCVFTVNSTEDKIYMGGDSNRANMNYIMQAYDNEDAYMYVAKETNTWGSEQYERWTEKIEGTINKTSSSTLSDISVFVALHHGKNTSNGFTQYLFGTTDAMDDKLDIVLYPYHQMYSATKVDSKTVDGVTYKNRYWMEDDSSVFEYLIETYNQNLYASANGKYYTYGYEDCTGATADSPHGTVELTFTLNGITPNELE